MMQKEKELAKMIKHPCFNICLSFLFYFYSSVPFLFHRKAQEDWKIPFSAKCYLVP